jgi:heme-degrading monooxygenase HmoA
MELLIATLAHTQKGGYDDQASRLQPVVDAVRNAPGIMNVRFYCSRAGAGYGLILTAWEDEELWQRAQERYNPRELLLQSAGDVLTTTPEQWQMRYLWGYSRPSAQPTIAEAHLATVQPDAANRIAQQWLDGLHQQAIAPTLAFAFLARGNSEDAMRYHTPGANGVQPALSHTFLNLLSWPGEAQRKEFYADQRYKALQSSLNNVGMVRVLALESS